MLFVIFRYHFVAFFRRVCLFEIPPTQTAKKTKTYFSKYFPKKVLFGTLDIDTFIKPVSLDFRKRTGPGLKHKKAQLVNLKKSFEWCWSIKKIPKNFFS